MHQVIGVIGVAAALIVNPLNDRVLRAATGTEALNVTANVGASCTIGAAPLAFGNYVRAELDVSTILTVTCTNATEYSIALDEGRGTNATDAERQMAGPGGEPLTHSLYTGTIRSSVWGTTTGSGTVPGIGLGAAQSITVYGRNPGSQLIEPGAYADTVTATLTY